MFANAGYDYGRDRVVTQGSPAEATDDTDSELGEMLPDPVIDVDPVKRRSPPTLPPLPRNNPFAEDDSPAIQQVNANDKNSIDNLSFKRDSDYGKSRPILSTMPLISSPDADESAADLEDFAVNTPNLLAVGQKQTAAIRDNAAIHQYEFMNAGVDLTTCGTFFGLYRNHLLTNLDIIANHVASEGTGIEGSPLIIDEQDELDKDQASNNFFAGTQIKEAPSPHHQPMVGKESGFVNIREGLEHIPQQWSHPQENLRQVLEDYPEAGIFGIVEEQHIDMTRDSNTPEHRVILKPVSQKAKAKAKARSVQSSKFSELEGEIPSFIDHRQRKNKSKPPPPIITHNLSTEEQFLAVAREQRAANKRAADNTFATRSAVIIDEDPTRVRGSKKSRANDTQAGPSFVRAQGAAGEIGNRYDDTQTYPNFTRAPNGVNDVDITINGNHGLPKIDPDEAARRRANAERHGVLELSELPSFSPFEVEAYRSPTISPITPEPEFAPLPAPLTPNPPAYAGQFEGISLYDLYTLARQPMTIRKSSQPPSLPFPSLFPFHP